MKLGINPVESHRREQKKLQKTKIQQERAARKSAIQEQANKLNTAKSELLRLSELQHLRPLTPAEKDLRKEYKQLHESNHATTDNSALFDPLARQHGTTRGHLVTTSSHRHTISRHNHHVPSSSSSSSSSSAHSLNWGNDIYQDMDSEPVSDLDDSFIPPLPSIDEPKPTHYIIPSSSSPIKYKTMSGYPPPPFGPLPRTKPQMQPPRITSTTISTSTSTIANTKNSTTNQSSSTVVSAPPQLNPSRREQVLSMVPMKVKERFITKSSQSVVDPITSHPDPTTTIIPKEHEEPVINHDDNNMNETAYAEFMKEMESLL